MKLVFTKYSTDRDAHFAIRTDRLVDKTGATFIKKHALFDEGKAHLVHMAEMSKKLEERYAGVITISKSTVEDGVLSNEFVEGTPYGDVIQEFIDSKDSNGLMKELETYRDNIYYSQRSSEDFLITPDFEEVFGSYDESILKDLKSYDVTDIDMVFENIIVSSDGTWQLIDYEWTFDFPIPRDYVLFRTLHYLYNSTEIAVLITWVDMMKWAEILPKLEKCFRDMEQHFQDYVLKGTVTIDRLVNAKKTPKAVYFDELLRKYEIYDDGVRYMNAYKDSEIKRQTAVRQLGILESDNKRMRKKADEIAANYNELKNAYIDANNELMGIKGSKSYKISNKIKKLK